MENASLRLRVGSFSRFKCMAGLALFDALILRPQYNQSRTLPKDVHRYVWILHGKLHNSCLLVQT